MHGHPPAKDEIIAKDLDLRHTVESAEPLTFHAEYDFGCGVIEYTAGNNVINARFDGNARECRVKLRSLDIGSAKRDFVKRFRLKDDMADIYSHIGTDEFMNKAIKEYIGMRVTRNDPWETTLCFIISQYNNVKRIRLIVRNFVREFGEDILDDEGNVLAKGFPTSERLMQFTDKDFREAGAGFRAKYIVKAAEFCTDNLDLYKLQNRNYDRLKGSLIEIAGVGDKVAV